MTASHATVAIADRPVLRIRTSLGGVSPEQRAAIVARRLQELLARGVPPRRLVSRKAGKNAELLYGSTLLLTVTPQEARAQNSSAASLAALWGHRLRALLSTPLLTVDRRQVTVPLGETRAISFGGLLRCPDTVTGEQGIVSLDLDGARRRAVIRGLQRGSTRLVFARGDASITVDVSVRPYAGRIPSGAECFVTGNPALPDLVARMARAAVRDALALEPGAWSHVGAPATKRGVHAGRALRVSVPVRLAGWLSPVTGDVPVTVRNLRLPRAGEPGLFYSNDPEQVEGYGTLFLGRLTTDQPVRLLYHHQNKMGRAFALSVDVINPGDEPARLHVVEGQGKPHPDPLRVGHEAAREFLKHHRAGMGYISVLPPRSRVTIVHHVLRPWHVGSGLFGLRQLEGTTGCLVQVKADDPRSPFVRAPDGDEPLSETVFQSAVKPIAASYEAGGRWTFIRLGSAFKAGASRLSEDGFGDYGVTYEMALTLSNPGRRRGRWTHLRGGLWGARRLPHRWQGGERRLSAHQELVLATYSPRGEAQVHVTTLPLRSAYPARLVLRSLPATVSVRPGTLLRRTSHAPTSSSDPPAPPRMARARALFQDARALAGAREYAFLFILFALLYRLTASRDYTFDSLSYALQIERFMRTGEYSWIFHPHHILFNVLGLGAFRAFRAIGLEVGTLDALQGMNALLGAVGVVLFAWIAGRVCRHWGAGLVAGAGLGLSYGYWTCSTDGRVNIAGVVVLVGALGAMAVLLGARGMESRASYLWWAAVLGWLHLLAVLLHQSHALCAGGRAGALALAGRPAGGNRRYLATTLGLGTLAYTVASGLANGSGAPSRVLAWAMTYAHRGHCGAWICATCCWMPVRCATFSWRTGACRRRRTGRRRLAFSAGGLAGRRGGDCRYRLGNAPPPGASV